MLCLHFHIKSQTNKLTLTGKWTKHFFTNGDIVMLLSAVQELGASNYRETLYNIVSSRCETSFTKYQIWQKAQELQSRITTRTSRRKKVSLAGNMTMFGSTRDDIFFPIVCASYRSYKLPIEDIQDSSPQKKEYRMQDPVHPSKSRIMKTLHHSNAILGGASIQILHKSDTTKNKNSGIHCAALPLKKLICGKRHLKCHLWCIGKIRAICVHQKEKEAASQI